jgi:hypothetical protein
MPPTPFRTFSLTDFRETRSWWRLAGILNGTGGCYGLCGPQGAGKTWLIERVIREAERRKGLGFLFPSPGAYQASEFLPALSETLAAAVQEHFRPGRGRAQAIRWLQVVLGVVVGLPLAVAIIEYLVRGLSGSKAARGSLFSVFPGTVWLVVIVAAALLAALVAAQAIRTGLPSGRLARQAAAMTERVRFSASLRLGTEIQAGRTGPIAGSLRRARERALAERPVTVASLVFDFRNLARLISHVLPGPLVIGIDELDKVTDPEIMRTLLREIKGIFEIPGVFFFVAMSEEAAGALQTGPLLAPGGNELNSSFYTIVELPPLAPQETAELLVARGLPDSRPLAQVLCILGAGNWREITRLAEHAASFPGGEAERHLSDLIMTVGAAETDSLLREITGNAVGSGVNALDDDAKLGAWNAFPPDAFTAEGRFTQLSKAAIREWWQPRWHDSAAWQVFRGPWQRLLIRLFVGGRVIVILERLPDPAAADAIATDLRDVVIMAGRSPGVAKFMLADRFGADLDGPYRPAGGGGR